MTTSLVVAEVFGKEHHNIIKAIKALECSPEFGQVNFNESKYLNKQNKLQPYYEITKDGFTFLAMGFTGSKAAEFKVKYIQALDCPEEFTESNFGLSVYKDKNLKPYINVQLTDSSPTPFSITYDISPVFYSESLQKPS